MAQKAHLCGQQQSMMRHVQSFHMAKHGHIAEYARYWGVPALVHIYLEYRTLVEKVGGKMGRFLRKRKEIPPIAKCTRLPPEQRPNE